MSIFAKKVSFYSMVIGYVAELITKSVQHIIWISYNFTCFFSYFPFFIPQET